MLAENDIKAELSYSSTTVVVHVPSTNILTPASLREIARRVSLGETLDHVQ